MFKRIVNYSNKYFNLFSLIDNISDGRAKPQIACSDIAVSILSILFCGLGSLNKFNNLREISSVPNISSKVPSASTIARVSDTIDLDCLRQALKSIYLKAKRSKMIEDYCGKYIGVVDGHEICSSEIYWCSGCSVRNVSKIEGEVKLNYYHRYTAFILVGPRFCFMLDIEPIYPGEGELTSSGRLLERVCVNYPKAFEVVVGDGLYLKGTVFNLLASHGKYAAAVLKDETRQLYNEAVLLSSISDPVVYADENTTYKVWDNTIGGAWDSYKKPVRVIKSEETKTQRHHAGKPGKWEISQEKADWYWVTNLPPVVSLKNVVSICHARWQIENGCFNEAVNTWNADHVYRHSQNAIVAFILFLFIALNIFNIFFARNIKDRRINAKSFLVELVKAEYILAKWTHPIPL
ncbi:MAG: transposase [Actinobacteria bacterium]|nr:transposase [Actinomycetota bacterium]